METRSKPAQRTLPAGKAGAGRREADDPADARSEGNVEAAVSGSRVGAGDSQAAGGMMFWRLLAACNQFSAVDIEEHARSVERMVVAAKRREAA